MNNYIKDYHERYKKIYMERQEYHRMLCAEFKLKNELKDMNLELIQKKYDFGMSQKGHMTRLFDLESDNARLKIQIKEIMEDYHKRI